MIHVRKVRAEYFEAIKAGKKLFELRRQEPDAPDFAAGDYLALNEWKDERYTGRCLLARIEYVLRAEDSCCTLRDNCVALGLKPMPLCGEDIRAIFKN